MQDAESDCHVAVKAQRYVVGHGVKRGVCVSMELAKTHSVTGSLPGIVVACATVLKTILATNL